MSTSPTSPTLPSIRPNIQSLSGYDKEVCPDGIIIYRFTVPAEGRFLSNAHTDAWFNDVTQVFAQAKAAGQAARLAYDVRALSIPSPYLLQRAQALARLPLPANWWVATIVRSQFAADVINFIRVASLSTADQTKRSLVFKDEYEALQWLRKQSTR